MLMPTRFSLLKDSLRRRYGSCYDRSNSTFIQILHHQRNEKRSLVKTCGRRQIVDQSPFNRSFSQRQQQKWSEIMSSSDGGYTTTSRPVWSEEWKRLGLGANLLDEPNFPSNLFFVQVGFGIDQHGNRSDATKASIRAVRNAIEFNSIPGCIQHIPGGRNEMLIHVKLGVPQQQKQQGGAGGDDVPATNVDVLEVAKVFPYGKLLPIEIVNGGLDFPTGRIVEELGDTDDIGICVCACVSIGYDDDDDGNKEGNETTTRTTSSSQHKTFNTKDGY